MRSPAPLLRNTVSALGPGPGDLAIDAGRGRRSRLSSPVRRVGAWLLGVLAAVVAVATLGQPVVTVTILVGLASVWYAFVARSLLGTLLSARGARRANPRRADGGAGTRMEDAA